MSKILAIDFGTKKCGLAISDENGHFAKRLPLIRTKNNDDSIKQISKIIHTSNVQKVILGLPLDENLEDTNTTKKVRAFANKLKKVIQVPIKFWDEYYTTRLSKMSAKTQKYKKKNLDGEAARIMLQEYLDSTFYSEKLDENISV